ncbi:2-dehydropantoate 2-reductase N-terminal domain-containing protein [Nocardioides hungaricus]
MRYVIVGLGGIGGTLAGLLHVSGSDVVAVARPGPHADAVRRHGLLLRRPDGDRRVPLDVSSSVDDIDLADDHVVVIAVKSQDTGTVLSQLAGAAPPGVHVVCAQNGVGNEREALRWFANVYGVLVQCPTLHLEPGVVAAYSAPTVGILDVGRYPSGSSEVGEAIARDWQAAGYSSRAVADIARWKYTKLITNLGNAVEAVCGPAARGGPLTDLLQDEARSVLDHHLIEYASAAEDEARRADLLQLHDIDGPRPGGSLWQSATRGQPTEVDYLCGEIVRLARLAGLAAPANEIMQRLTHGVTSGQVPIAGTPEESVLAIVDPR